VNTAANTEIITVFWSLDGLVNKQHFKSK